jgi:acetyl/propionyl-CoA carboxylase alpha subunit
MFDKILIANRGEIACRVMRTARALGYRCVAVFSDADRDAPHVALADDAVHIGAAPAAQSYLHVPALLEAARSTGAGALHPGYGFLSERADFAQACVDAGLVFIGPPAAAIAAMGDKAVAKKRMLDAGVPCAPGYLGDDQTERRLAAEAERLGYPLLVKAVAGGGGRGMRLVAAPRELAPAITAARREAESAFGDGRLMLERLVTGGRHIEIQVFADRHGNALHLGERDCSAQRRRQKVIEEAPSPALDPERRAAMGRDAVQAALAVGYQGAGTVEFIVDAAMKHYFLEMNTRLQVEHPVTECITGFDLVEWQLRVAQGEPLPVAQEEVRFEGHAIEARLYAEDPYDGFRPQAGRIAYWRPQAALQAVNPVGAALQAVNPVGAALPAANPVGAALRAANAAGTAGLRIDAGIAEGGSVTPFYDPLLAKLIVHGRDRADAIRRLRRALEDTPLLGVANNGRYLRDLLGHPAFAAGAMTTALLDDWAAAGEPIAQRPLPADEDWHGAAAARALRDGAGVRPPGVAAWGMTLRCGPEQRRLRVRVDGGGPQADGPAMVEVSDGSGTHALRVLSHRDAWLRVEVAGVQRRLLLLDDGECLHLARDAAVFVFDEPSPYPQAAPAGDPRRAVAPVAGVLAQLLVRAGERVAAGQPLASVEAMKMEMWVAAAAGGTVRALHAAPGDAVEAGALLVELEAEPGPPPPSP